MRHPVPAAGAFALAVACVACSGTRPAPCPGDPIATLRFHAVLVPGTTCSFSFSPTPPDFTATIASTSDGAAFLCPDRAEAAPLTGTRTGDHLVLAGAAAPADAPSCACAPGVSVLEQLVGDLSQVPGGVTFTGDLANHLTPPEGVDPATCEPATPPGSTPVARCGVPCDIHWTLTGAP